MTLGLIFQNPVTNNDDDDSAVKVVRRGVIVDHVPHHLNSSVWEYQSALLDCIYHTARQSGAAGGYHWMIF